MRRGLMQTLTDRSRPGAIPDNGRHSDERFVLDIERETKRGTAKSRHETAEVGRIRLLQSLAC